MQSYSTFSNWYFEAKDFMNNITLQSELKEAGKIRNVMVNDILNIMIKIKQDNLCLCMNSNNIEVLDIEVLDIDVLDIDVFIAIAQKLHQPEMFYTNIKSGTYMYSVELWNQYIKKEKNNQLVVDLLITKCTY